MRDHWWYCKKNSHGKISVKVWKEKTKQKYKSFSFFFLNKSLSNMPQTKNEVCWAIQSEILFMPEVEPIIHSFSR